MKIRFLLLFIVIGLFSCVIFSVGSLAEQNIEELIRKFGAPHLDEYKTIPKDISGYEIEPDFTIYFTKKELDNEVIVRHIVWKFSTSTIQVWSKNVNGVWVVFYSVEYGENVRF